MDQTKINLENQISELAKQVDHNRELLKTAEGVEFRQLVEEEIKRLKEQKAQLEDSLKLLSDSYDESDKSTGTSNGDLNPNLAILEIRAGTGGDEAGLFAADLYKIYFFST